MHVFIIFLPSSAMPVPCQPKCISVMDSFRDFWRLREFSPCNSQLISVPGTDSGHYSCSRLVRENCIIILCDAVLLIEVRSSALSGRPLRSSSAHIATSAIHPQRCRPSSRCRPARTTFLVDLSSSHCSYLESSLPAPLNVHDGPGKQDMCCCVTGQAGYAVLALHATLYTTAHAYGVRRRMLESSPPSS